MLALQLHFCKIVGHNRAHAAQLPSCTWLAFAVQHLRAALGLPLLQPPLLTQTELETLGCGMNCRSDVRPPVGWDVKLCPQKGGPLTAQRCIAGLGTEPFPREPLSYVQLVKDFVLTSTSASRNPLHLALARLW